MLEVPVRGEPAQAQGGLGLLRRMHAQQHHGLSVFAKHCTNSSPLPEDAVKDVAASYGINMATCSGRSRCFRPGADCCLCANCVPCSETANGAPRCCTHRRQQGARAGAVSARCLNKTSLSTTWTWARGALRPSGLRWRRRLCSAISRGAARKRHLPFTFFVLTCRTCPLPPEHAPGSAFVYAPLPVVTCTTTSMKHLSALQAV